MHRLQDPGRNPGKTIGLTLSALPYTGRFAPSPTGPLHLGSLYAALASYLDARKNHGRWLLRIDDLDTPRNTPGATEAILRCLEGFGLHWDGEVYYQSRHPAGYDAAIGRLLELGRLYSCDCSRKRLSAYPGVYPGFCRNRRTPSDPHALRVKADDLQICFHDAIQGLIGENLAALHGDFIIKRKDGIIAYQLAAAVDDHAQQISRVVRGYDLLESTSRQIYLQTLLGYPTPEYMHVPVIVDRQGEKLSKQTRAAAVGASRPEPLLYLLLRLLKQQPPAELAEARAGEMLTWAAAHWRPELLEHIHTAPEVLES